MIREEQRHFYFEQAVHSPELKPHILNIWHFWVGGPNQGYFEHYVPADGCLALVLSQHLPTGEVEQELSGWGLNKIQRLNIRYQTYYLGFRFRPGSFSAFFDIKPKDLLGRYQSLGKNSGLEPYLNQLKPKANLPLNALETWLLSQKRRPQDDLVGRLSEWLKEQSNLPHLELLPKIFFLSQRQLERRFLREAGIGMRRFWELQRLRRILEAWQEPQLKLQELAYDQGFSDAAHFSRRIREVSGKKAADLRAFFSSIKLGDLSW